MYSLVSLYSTLEEWIRPWTQLDALNYTVNCTHSEYLHTLYMLYNYLTPALEIFPSYSGLEEWISAWNELISLNYLNCTYSKKFPSATCTLFTLNLIKCNKGDNYQTYFPDVLVGWHSHVSHLSELPASMSASRGLGGELLKSTLLCRKNSQ